MKNTTGQVILTAVIAICGVLLFQLIHAPIPYLLGPMTSVLIATKVFHLQLKWPKTFRDAGLLVIGYSLGSTFTAKILFEMALHVPVMFGITTFTFVISIVFAFIVSKVGHMDYPTALTSSVPGGLSQILIFAEEMDGIDMTTVTFFHTIRVIMVVFLVPMVLYLPWIQSGSSNNIVTEAVNPINYGTLAIFALLCILGMKVSKKLHIPAPYILGPIIVTLISNLTFIQASPLPIGVLSLCQLLIGTHIGLLLKPENLYYKKQIFTLAFASSLLLIGVTFLLSIFVMVRLENTSILTGFLSLAPGGMDQMGIIAHEVGADVSTITIYQVFRMLYIYILIPPFLTFVLKRYRNKNAHS
ncbi:AbrB family transcriptional regulator [Viridibacillus sp. YIM B01967]|uniref:AbrB family transcriptional regulator n=1 Tax=Viridibacillus soli TaxID=2798301 RepID=A0ABS1H2Y9_9BACL|nr:AbrB family transcriptional regulator [Viridibacillus soli]MBK3493671.1 AbrB family transcriptional regulator [Viridibacillus soli]